MIIAKVTCAYEKDATNVSEDAVAARVQDLVERGRLAAQGELSNWRYSEVRLLRASK